MSTNNDNQSTFNLPSYINIPLFLYQDNRLEKAATLMAAFFYSLFTAGKSIQASKDYLCALAGISKTQYYCSLNQLELCGYIKRSGNTCRRVIKWSYCPNSEIIVNESDEVERKLTDVKKLNTSPASRTKLVREAGLDHIIEDTKDYKKLTTLPKGEKTPKSSSSFFSEKQTAELLNLKLPTDERPDEVFLANCQHHIENQVNENGTFQRLTGLKKILTALQDTGEDFRATGFGAKKAILDPGKPTQYDFQEFAAKIKGYEWVGEWIKKQKQG